jgi:hypothetical protein
MISATPLSPRLYVQREDEKPYFDPGMNDHRGFLDRPGEIVNLVYGFLCASTRLSYGRYKGRWRLAKPAPYSLAILRTCRQMYEEATGLWKSGHFQL